MRFYRTLHFLSLDIVAGALATSCVAFRLFEAEPGWSWWVSLALTVWLLYTGDHILDAWKQRKASKRPLHRFLFTHRRILLWAMGVAAIADLLITFNLFGQQLLRSAMFLGGAVFLFYAMRHVFRRNRFLFIPGEVFVLLLYLAGTWLGPFVTRTVEPDPAQGTILLMMAGVLLVNLGIISLYDVGLDSRLGIASLARTLGTRTTRNLMVVAGIMTLLLGLLQFMVHGLDRLSQLALILAGMMLLLMLVLMLPSRFRKDESYRLVADAVLWMGFLALLVG